MMDLIDRAAMIRRLKDHADGKSDFYKSAILTAVMFAEEAPTVEAVPMRRTKPVMGVSKDQLRNWWQCGNCESVIDKGDRYCRGCGAEVEWDSAIT